MGKSEGGLAAEVCFTVVFGALLLLFTANTRAQAVPQAKEKQTFVLVGAGDISSCKSPAGAQATAKLIEQIPGTVFAAGDLAYEKGSAEEFKDCYGTTWGRFKDR